jgi:hypothetical protein
MTAATTTENQISLDYESLRARLWEFEDIMRKQQEPEAEEGE